MALYDNRVFKADGKWWVAEVHGASGTGTSLPPRIMHEMVVFTCLSDDTLKSLSASLPARHLRAIAHESLLALLKNAEPFADTRISLRPTNTPDADELSSERVVLDHGGLRWVVRTIKQLRISASGIVDGDALEVTCLDDSAMRRELALEKAEYDVEEVIERVRSSFPPYYVKPRSGTMTRHYRWKRNGVPSPPPGVEQGRCYAVDRYQDERGTKLTLNLLTEDGTVVAKDVPRFFLEECPPGEIE